MRYNLYFDMSAICITFVILIAAQMSKWIPTYQNRYYHNMVRGVFLTALINFLTCYLEVADYSAASWYPQAKFALDSVYHIVHVMSGMFFLRFTMSMINMKANTFLRRLMVYGPWLVTVASLVLNLFYPVMFYYEGQGVYRRGPFIAVIYAAGAYYLLTAVMIVARHQKSVRPQVLRAMRTYAALATTGVAIQTVYPVFMVGEFFNALALTLMYTNVESADDIKDETYGVLNRRAYLRQAAVNAINKVPSQSLFVVISDSHAMTSGGSERMHTELMKQIIRFLKRYRKEVWIAVWNDKCIAMEMRQPDTGRAEAILTEIEDRFREPWTGGDYTQLLGFTGWSIRFPQDVSSVEELVERTELLIDVDSHRHRGVLHFENIDFNELGCRRMMEHAAEAVRRQTAEVRYEPIVRISSGEIISARSVIFFPNEKGEYINGNLFLDPSADVDVIAGFDEYALSDACRSKDILMNHTTLEEVSTRLSYAMLSHPNFKERLRRIIERNHADYRKCMLRISDSSLNMLSAEQTAELEEMRNEGWLFAIDDFGYGQSYFSHLSDIEIPYLILRPAVSHELAASENGRKLGEGLIHALHGLNKSVTMTGIETEEEAKAAKEMGADYMCGPALSEPMTALDFQNWMKARSEHAGLQ